MLDRCGTATRPLSSVLTSLLETWLLTAERPVQGTTWDQGAPCTLTLPN